jgi:hypothetical protein
MFGRLDATGLDTQVQRIEKRNCALNNGVSKLMGTLVQHPQFNNKIRTSGVVHYALPTCKEGAAE